jgi:hypothetical protein
LDSPCHIRDSLPLSLGFCYEKISSFAIDLTFYFVHYSPPPSFSPHSLSPPAEYLGDLVLAISATCSFSGSSGVISQLDDKGDPVISSFVEVRIGKKKSEKENERDIKLK